MLKASRLPATQQTLRDPSGITARPLCRRWVTSPRHPLLTGEQTHCGKASKSLPTADPSDKTRCPEKRVILEAATQLDGALPFWMGLQVLLLYCTRLAPALTARPPGEMMKPSVSPCPRASGVPSTGTARRGIWRRGTDPAQLEQDWGTPRWLFPVTQQQGTAQSHLP